MKQHQVGERQFAIIDGELWMKAESVPEVDQPEAMPAKRAYKTKKKIVKTGRKARHNLDAGTKARIREGAWISYWTLTVKPRGQPCAVGEA